MRTIICLLLSLTTYTLAAQIKLVPTDQFIIEGKVKGPLTISISDLDSFPVKNLPDLVITNHLGVKLHTLTQLKGILLKDILSKVELDAESPKVLSAYYFVLAASDNYKIVFSWNEIFNSETGNNIYIITEEEGKNIKETNDRIAIVTLTDLKTGRRHMSNIEKIMVARAQ
jgi:hypothetical protein